MADKVYYSSELKLKCLFDDDDTRIITYDNPDSGIDATTIKAIESDMIANQPLIGDKTGAAFVKFLSAKVVDRQKIVLDI